jgi:hypothetical protein
LSGAEREMRRRALQSARFSVQPYYAVVHSLEALGQFLILGDDGVRYSTIKFRTDEGNVVTLTNVYISLTAQTIAEVETRPELLQLDFQLLETQPNKLQIQKSTKP